VHQVILDWQYFTMEVARGYPYTIYDYTNDLIVRDRIAEVVAGVVPLPPHLAERVAECDARFRNATVERSTPLPHLLEMFGGQPVEPRGWWWFRHPTQPGEELAADLASEER
jgi:hypothetical protein